MAQVFYLYNNYSTFYLAIDPTISDFGLRALQASDNPLAFTFTPIDSSSLVKICTAKTAKTYCLDVYGDKKYTPHLTDPGNTSGQQWSIIPADTAFKLSNQYTGSGWFLDVYSDTKAAFMSNQDYAGQYWMKKDAGTAAIASTASALSTSSVSQTITQLLPTSTLAAPLSGIPAASSGLTTSAKAGIGVGCGVLVAAVGILIFYILFWKRRQSGSSGSLVAGQTVFWNDPNLEAKPHVHFQPHMGELSAHLAVHEMPGRGMEHLPK